MRRELTTEYQLFAENRAFALRDNFEILEDELKRLALLPEMNPGRRGPPAGREHPGRGARALGPLQHRRAAARFARPLRAVGAGSPRVSRAGVRRPIVVRKRTRWGDGTALSRDGRTDVGANIEDRAASGRGGASRDAGGRHLVGEDNLIAPALHENLPRETDAVLIDDAGEVIYPTDRARAAERSGWARAIAAAARGGTGTLTAEANGQQALFAYSPVRADTHFAVVFSWPWRTLTGNLERQGATLAGILIFGVVLASMAAVMLAGYLSRPLQALAAAASRIARGERLPAAERPRAGTDEISSLLGLRAHGTFHSEARSGFCARLPGCSSSGCEIARRSWWRRRRRWWRPNGSPPWARPRRRLRTR